MKSKHAQDLQKIFDGLMAHDSRPPEKRGVGAKPGKPSRLKILGATVTDVSPANPTDSGGYSDTGLPLFSLMSLDDINQGQLSNCYFLSALAGLVNTVNGKAQLQKIITVDGADSKKAIVQYTRNGLITRVHCDLLVPNMGNRLVGPDKDLWVEVCEKSYAFFRTGADTYASLNFGFSAAVLSDLGCTPTGNLLYSNRFALIKAAMDAQNPVSLGTPAAPPVGLVGSHSYAVLSINADNSVNLYNPWGQPFSPYVTLSAANFTTANILYCEFGTTPIPAPTKGLMINLTSTTNIPIDSQSAFSGCQIETGFGFKDWGFVDAVNGASISYDLNVQTAGTYGLTLGVASNGVMAGMDILANGVNVGSLQFSSPAWQTFVNKSVNIALPAGAVSLKIQSQKPTQYNLKAIAIGPAITASDLDILKAKVASAVSLMNQAIQALS